MIKFSHLAVWQAVYKICPHFKVMCDNKITVNLPSAMKDCALQLFLKHHNKDALSYEMMCAEYIIGCALQELSEIGFITFGDRDTLWL